MFYIFYCLGSVGPGEDISSGSTHLLPVTDLSMDRGRSSVGTSGGHVCEWQAWNDAARPTDPTGKTEGEEEERIEMETERGQATGTHSVLVRQCDCFFWASVLQNFLNFVVNLGPCWSGNENISKPVKRKETKQRVT